MVRRCFTFIGEAITRPTHVNVYFFIGEAIVAAFSMYRRRDTRETITF
jgi:hypothetical protein